MNVFDYFFENSKNLQKDFVLGNKETITYLELYQNSLKLSNYLIQRVGVNKNIIVIGHNSVFFITVYLAILKSGNVCVPLDFSIELENFDFIKELTKSELVFCDSKTQVKLNIDNNRDSINEVEFKMINENNNIDDYDNYAAKRKENKNNDLAEIIFTSGSTGKPKGVMISHNNLIANTNSIISYLELGSNDIGLIVLPFYYCFGLSLLHTHLRVGASVVINNTFMFLGTVISDLKKYRCTNFSGVPSHFQMLLKKSKTFKNEVFPDLKFVIQAGGKLHDVFIKEFVGSFPDIDFTVMYGQTEATARLSYLPHKKVLTKLGSIGKPIPGVELKIVDSKGAEVETGAIGEIIAKGQNVMLGYFQDHEGTKEVVKNGWLYTGDLAKMDNDGFITIVARAKEIIKVGGKRISPKEIEGVILSVPLVVDCTIKGIYDDVLGEALLAIVIIDQFDKKDQIKEEILKQCKARLALYKIPQKYEFKNRMKVKSTGKKA